MDKTAWFVVTCCVLLLGLNFWYGSQNTPAPASQPPAATAAATPAATAVSTASATQPAEPQPAVEPEEVAMLTSHSSTGEEVARFRFRNVGGSLASVEMVGKAINSTNPDLQADVRLNSQASQGIGTIMYGLSDTAAPVFDTAVYSVVEQDATKVVLEGKVDSLLVRKTYSLKPLEQNGDTLEGNAYCLHLTIQVQNTTPAQSESKNWGIYTGAAGPISSSEWQSYTYYVLLEDGSFDKESIGSFKPFFGKEKARIYTTDADKISWGGVMDQYYATLVRPTSGNEVHSYFAAPVKHFPVPGSKPDDASATGVEFALGIPNFSLSAAQEGQAGGVHTLEYDIYTGPKLNLMLTAMNKEFPKIDRIMDYGIFHIISYPMNWLINKFYYLFGNWGWAIVAMTFVVRLLIWPLYRKSYMSMKRMSLLQPKITELRAKYPNDQQRVTAEMMKLYRDYNISPFGGCLPMLLQIPIFFSFFYVLQTAAEFRGAPFIGWVTDLSQMDTVATLPLGGWSIPINVLPILMVATMVLQMRLTPQAGDPSQRRIMHIMPVIFFVFCYTYPSALALYWTTTNVISIIQTFIIRRLPQPELQRVDPKLRKKSMMERLVASQQAALAEQQRRQARKR